MLVKELPLSKGGVKVDDVHPRKSHCDELEPEDTEEEPKKSTISSKRGTNVGRKE